MKGKFAFFLSFVAFSCSFVFAIRDVRLIPHSHCDVGWLKTVEGYYDDSVHSILNTVVESLAKDPSLRFIWSETKWIQMWWDDATADQKAKLEKIVSTGQLEFVGGGWSQNDEVVTAWDDVVDNVATGHEFLRRIGLEEKCPQKNRCIRFGWQIDMFDGYSGVTPTLWALSGFDGMFLRSAMTFEMEVMWWAEHWYQYLWDGSPNVPSSRSRIFTHIMEVNYGTFISTHIGDLGFKWEDEGVAPVTPSNIEDYAAMLSGWVLLHDIGYYQPGTPFFVAWGSDFRFRNADIMFGNMSLVIDEINKHPEKYDMKVQYNTLAEYVDSLHNMNMSYPVKKWPLDFEFGWPHEIMQPNGNDTIQYQTGAQTSRSVYKKYVRSVSSLHHAAERAHALDALVKGTKQGGEILSVAWDALGVVQHHDSLPGTMSAAQSTGCDGKPECSVLEDYTKQLDGAVSVSVKVLVEAIEHLSGLSSLSLEQSGTRHTVIIFNPLGHDRENSPVKVDLPKDLVGTPVVVSDWKGKPISSQLSVEGDSVWFFASVPALGRSTYFLGKASSRDNVFIAFRPVVRSGPCSSMENDRLAVSFDSVGFVSEITDKFDQISVKVKQRYWEYWNSQGGAYLLIETSTAKQIPDNLLLNSSCITGPVVQESVQVFNYGEGQEKLKQTVRLFAGNDDSLSVVHGVPEIPLTHELISRLETDLETKGKMYNDDTGMELFPRERDITKPISASYYSLVRGVGIRDEDTPSSRELMVLTQHTMGSSSLSNGQLEYMLVRRLNTSDNQGPAPMDDDVPLDVEVRWMIGSSNRVRDRRLPCALDLDNPLRVLYGDGDPKELHSSPITALPDNIHLLSFYERDPGVSGTVVRLQNVVEGGAAESVDMSKLLSPSGLVLSDCTEKTLSLQQTRSDNKRLQWNSRGEDEIVRNEESTECDGSVEFGSMDIRSFVLRY